MSVIARKAYENGELVGTVYLVKLDGHLVEWQTAVCFVRMAACARRDAQLDFQISSGFRTMAEQKKLYQERMTLPGDSDEERARKANRRQRSGIAASPGYSRHQNGTAIDVITGMSAADHRAERYSVKYLWLKKNAQRFGFAVDTVKNEPWHLERVIELERWRA